jgi:hypothetical protein
MTGKDQKRIGGAIINGQSKKFRKIITLEQKFSVLEQYENNEKTCNIVHVTSLNEATLRTIRQMLPKLEQAMLVLL